MKILASPGEHCSVSSAWKVMLTRGLERHRDDSTGVGGFHCSSHNIQEDVDEAGGQESSHETDPCVRAEHSAGEDVELRGKNRVPVNELASPLQCTFAHPDWHSSWTA